MKDNEKEELLDKVKTSLPSLLKVALTFVPGIRTIGLVTAGTVWVFALAFPSIIDGDTAHAILSALGV